MSRLIVVSAVLQRYKTFHGDDVDRSDREFRLLFVYAGRVLDRRCGCILLHLCREALFRSSSGFSSPHGGFGKRWRTRNPVTINSHLQDVHPQLVWWSRLAVAIRSASRVSIRSPSPSSGECRTLMQKVRHAMAQRRARLVTARTMASGRRSTPVVVLQDVRVETVPGFM